MQHDDDHKRALKLADDELLVILARVIAPRRRCNVAHIRPEYEQRYRDGILQAVEVIVSGARDIARMDGLSEIAPSDIEVFNALLLAGSRVAQTVLAEASRRLRDPHGRPTPRNPLAPAGTYRPPQPAPKPRKNEHDTNPYGNDAALAELRRRTRFRR